MGYPAVGWNEGGARGGAVRVRQRVPFGLPPFEFIGVVRGSDDHRQNVGPCEVLRRKRVYLGTGRSVWLNVAVSSVGAR